MIRSILLSLLALAPTFAFAYGPGINEDHNRWVETSILEEMSQSSCDLTVAYDQTRAIAIFSSKSCEVMWAGGPSASVATMTRAPFQLPEGTRPGGIGAPAPAPLYGNHSLDRYQLLERYVSSRGPSRSEAMVQAGLGVLAQGLMEAGQNFNVLPVEFKEGEALERSLHDITDHVRGESARIRADIARDLPVWKEKNSAHLAAWSVQQTSRFAEEQKQAAATFAAAASIAQATPPALPPSELAAREAVVGASSKETLSAEIKAAIQPASLRASGTSFAGLLTPVRQTGFTGATPFDRSVEREERKWTSSPAPAAAREAAAARLAAAQAFAESGANAQARALYQEARSLRYRAEGKSSVSLVATDSNGRVDSVETRDAGAVPNALYAKVERFEQQQSVLEAKESLVEDELASRRLSDVETRRAENAVALSSSLRDSAKQEFYAAHEREAYHLQGLAGAVTDIALSFTPGVNVAKDFYELTTGYSLVTGEELSATSRTLAAVGVLTAGISSEALAAGKAAVHAARLAQDATRVEQALARAAKLLEGAVHSEPAMRYIGKMKAAYEDVKPALSADQLIEGVELVAKRYGEVFEAMKQIPGEERVLDVLRVIPAKIMKNGKEVDSVAADAFSWHEKLRASISRFSLGGSAGNEGLYAVVMSAKKSLQETIGFARTEASLEGKAYTLGRMTTRQTRAIDLTKAENLEKLGTDVAALTLNPRKEPMAYVFTQMVGDIAAEQGFTSILFTSAENADFVNAAFLRDILR